MDDFDTDQVLVERPLAGRIRQHRVGKLAVPAPTSGGLDPDEKILERFAVQMEWISLERLDGQIFTSGLLPPAQEDSHIPNLTLDGFGKAISRKCHLFATRSRAEMDV